MKFVPICTLYNNDKNHAGNDKTHAGNVKTFLGIIASRYLEELITLYGNH
jgi:hypothetical protein